MSTGRKRSVASRPTGVRLDDGLKLTQSGPTACSPASLRDYRLDVLKGLAICLVMLWHTQPFANFWQLPVHLPTYFFNFEITLTAVPVLFTISLMLLMQRTSRGLVYLRRRLQRLLIVLVVCFAVQVLVYVAALHHWPTIGWHEIWLGGPALPTVGDSVFYFLVNLLLLTALAWPFALLPERWRTIVDLAVIVASGVLFEVLVFSNWSLPYYSPLNFLVYIPLADLILRYRTGLSRWFWVTVAGFAVLACQDMLLLSPWGFRRAVLAGPLRRAQVGVVPRRTARRSHSGLDACRVFRTHSGCGADNRGLLPARCVPQPNAWEVSCDRRPVGQPGKPSIGQRGFSTLPLRSGSRPPPYREGCQNPIRHLIGGSLGFGDVLLSRNRHGRLSRSASIRVATMIRSDGTPRE